MCSLYARSFKSAKNTKFEYIKLCVYLCMHDREVMKLASIVYQRASRTAIASQRPESNKLKCCPKISQLD